MCEVEQYWGNMLAALAEPEFIQGEDKADITVEVDVSELHPESDYEDILEAALMFGKCYWPSLDAVKAVRSAAKEISAAGQSVLLVLKGLSAYADKLITQHMSRIAEEGRDLDEMRDWICISITESIQQETDHLRQLSGASELTTCVGW